MPTFILVLQNDVHNNHWLARKWGNTPAALKPCRFNSANNQIFQKDPADQIAVGPCPIVTDENGNQANAFMVQLANT